MSKSKFAVRLIALAQQDLQDIVEYVAMDSASAAGKLADGIAERLENLEHHPLLGRVPGDPKLARMRYRVLVVDDYLVFYKVQAKTVLVHRILHGARDFRSIIET